MEPTEGDPDELLRKAVNLQRLLVGGLTLGATTLGGILTAVHFAVLDGKGLMGDPPAVGGIPVFTVLAALTAVGTAGAALGMMDSWRRPIVGRRAATHPTASPADRPALVQGWQACHLIRAGVCEAQAVLALILFLMSGDPIVLSIAAVMLVLLAVQFPSAASARRWLDTAEDELATARAAG